MRDSTSDALATNAELAERAGRPDATRLWDTLCQTYPEHPRALYIEGKRRIASGDAKGALAYLTRAEASDPAYADAPLYTALAHKMLGNLRDALAAIDRALANDPYFFLALLSKGAVVEQMGKPRLAAQIFKNALKIAPPMHLIPPAQRPSVEHAKARVAANSEALAKHLHERMHGSRPNGAELERFDESIDILAGLKPRQIQEPILYYYPRLPAIPFHDRAHFDWLPKLEAATDIIRGELERVLREDQDKFSPYIQMPAGAPVNQWAELNHSPLWSTFHLWRDGAPVAESYARCPQTAALLDSLPMAKQPGFAPNCVFSVLSPHTHIPPHTGSTNIRLLVHLPLILPPKCRFRVGNETREWRMGQAWVFDDSIEHEAWNDSDQFRVIMIFDVWNPLLTEAERTLTTQLLGALNEFNAGDGKS